MKPERKKPAKGRPRSRAAPSGVFTAIELHNVRCFGDAKVGLHSRLTIIIGENGAGKSTIAEAIASLSAGDREGMDKFPLRKGASEGRIVLRDDAGAEWTWSVGAGTQNRRRLPEDRFVFAYGKYRRVHVPDQAVRNPMLPEILGPEWQPSVRLELLENLSNAVHGRRTTTLFRPDEQLLGDLADYIALFHSRRAEDRQMRIAWDRFNASLRSLGQGLEGLDVTTEGDRAVPVVVKRGVPLKLAELSDGYQALLVIVLDLIFRYAYLFPSADDPMEGEATVVIDEVDLHLHPGWQRLVVRQLTNLFPKTQFILTTHSAQVVQGAIDEGYKVVVLRAGVDGVEASEIGPSRAKRLKQAGIGAVLIDKILFDVPSRYSQQVEAIEQSAHALNEKLESGEGTEADRKRLLVALEKLRLIELADEERKEKEPLMAEIAKTQINFLNALHAEIKRSKRGPSR